MRLDQFLVLQGYYSTRSKASAAIKEKRVKINGKTITKAGAEVDENCSVEIIRPERTFVSRGGYKLQGAIDQFEIDLSGKTVLDIGASTGGFTDCALQSGAAKVYAYDVGTDQLDISLRNDPRVISKENVNCRFLKKEDFSDEIDFICMDVSFISCTKMMEAISDILSKGKTAVILFKPQFEVGRENLNRSGIVINQNAVDQKLDECILLAEKLDLQLTGKTLSAIKGTDGNQEYLLYFEKK